ncbi:hypothetical protein B4082_4276 [Bacillus cereus]|nr:hypothetical protein B4082_4276 [Bacillus cereus]
MRKKVRKSFKQLLIENKQSLLNNKENMKEIEERIEKRHVAYSGASNFYFILKKRYFSLDLCKYARYFYSVFLSILLIFRG